MPDGYLLGIPLNFYQVCFVHKCFASRRKCNDVREFLSIFKAKCPFIPFFVTLRHLFKLIIDEIIRVRDTSEKDGEKKEGGLNCRCLMRLNDVSISEISFTVNDFKFLVFHVYRDDFESAVRCIIFRGIVKKIVVFGGIGC